MPRARNDAVCGDIADWVRVGKVVVAVEVVAAGSDEQVDVAGHAFGWVADPLPGDLTGAGNGVEYLRAQMVLADEAAQFRARRFVPGPRAAAVVERRRHRQRIDSLRPQPGNGLRQRREALGHRRQADCQPCTREQALCRLQVCHHALLVEMGMDVAVVVGFDARE